MGSGTDEVESHTYLRLRFSSDLRWKSHINEISTKAVKKLNLMVPLKMKVDCASLEVMYNVFYNPPWNTPILFDVSYKTDLQKPGCNAADSRCHT